MLRGIGELNKKNDIVIVIDKGAGVGLMDKSDYVRLLRESSINNETKFRPVCAERPKMRGRSPKHFHLLAERKKVNCYCRKNITQGS